jgi:hypothetical protein
MNRKPSGSSISISKAMISLILKWQKTCPSARSIYTTGIGIGGSSLRAIKIFVNVTHDSLIKFMNWLRNEYTPQRFSGKRVAPQSVEYN